MNFDRVAPWFERLEKIVFGDQMQVCRTAFLSDLPAIKKAALIGEGNGTFLAQFLKHCDCEEIHYIDSSKKMLDLAQKQFQMNVFPGLERMVFYHLDLSLDVMPDQNYDLVVTNFFLDVFNGATLNNVVSKIASACTRDAHWLYADFQVTGNRFQRCRAIAWVKTMYLFFRLAADIQTMKLTNPSALLDRNGFQIKWFKEFDNGLMRAEIRQRKDEFVRDAGLF
ncbi:Methyltransferase domain protein [Gimesia algae]|uniref:Methyltransferase domain protein n=2 Tax=Gimesia algae TaxID=2527971 RepID=A0A517VMY4_9PLAN|nr:Methyltransferase domain protein [Gimesia algae]